MPTTIVPVESNPEVESTVIVVTESVWDPFNAVLTTSSSWLICLSKYSW